MTVNREEQVRELLEKWVTEALELRFGATLDPKGSLPEHPGTHPTDIVDVLVRVRQRADRVEEILAAVRRLRGRLNRSLLDAQLEAEIKKAEAFQTNAAHRVADFVSADERRADAALASIQEKRAAHSAKRLADEASEAYDTVDGCRWGLSAYRQDLRAILHAMQVVRSIENSTEG